MDETEEQTIETIKRFADEKRKIIQKVNPELDKERQQKRLENLAKGREIRRLKLLEKKAIPEIKEEVKQPKKPLKNKKAMVVEDDEESEEEIAPYKGELCGLWQYLADKDEREREKKEKKEKEKNKNFDTLYKEITDIKEIITKPKAKPKPKQNKVIKTLDLTVSDIEVEKIINGNRTLETFMKEEGDAKLQAFLDALQKK